MCTVHVASDKWLRPAARCTSDASDGRWDAADGDSPAERERGRDADDDNDDNDDNGGADSGGALPAATMAAAPAAEEEDDEFPTPVCFGVGQHGVAR